jgi:hypothetical protein
MGLVQVDESQIIRNGKEMEIVFGVTDDNVLLFKIVSDQFATHKEFFEREDGLNLAIGALKQVVETYPPKLGQTEWMRVVMAYEAALVTPPDGNVEVEFEVKRHDGTFVPTE